VRLALVARLVGVAVAAAAVSAASGITDVTQLSTSSYGNEAIIIAADPLGTEGTRTIASADINANVVRVTNAVHDAITLTQSYGTATSTALTAGNLIGTTLCVSQTGSTCTSSGDLYGGSSYNGNSNEHVYSINNGSFAANTVMTINASANQYVIINVGCNTTLNGAGCTSANTNFSLFGITLTGGITSDHVLFNVLYSGELSSGDARGDTLSADIIDYYGRVNLDSFDADARFLCRNCFFPDPHPRGSLDSAPEPVTFALAGAGLLAMAFGIGRVKTRRPRK